MKFVIYSRSGDALALAPRLMREGNDVWIYLERGRASYDGTGIPKLDKFVVPDGAVVLMDMVGRGALVDDLRRRGIPVVGPGRFADRLELDRAWGATVMQATGIPIPPTRVFDSFDDGIRFAESAKRGLFFKPHGNKPTAMTFGHDDPQVVARMLRYYARRWTGPVRFELQDKVEGIELSIEGWFNGHDWLVPFNSTFEDKRLHAGDLGPNTGSMASVVWAWQHARPRIAKQTLLRLTRLLRKAGYIGPLDLNTKGGLGLEFTARFGYDALWALIELLDVEVGRLLSDLARGQARQMPLKRDVAFALRVLVPPEPDGRYPRGLPIQGVKFGDPHVWLLDVMIDRDGELVTAGVDGVVAVVTGTGRTVEDARRQVFRRVHELRIPNMIYRVDAGERAARQMGEVLRTYVQ